MPRAGGRNNLQRRKEVAPPFPVQGVQEVMEKAFPEGVVKPEAAVHLTAVLEYLAVEIIEQTANAAISRAYRESSKGKVVLTENDLNTAIAKDKELKALMEQFGFSEPVGGLTRIGRS